MWLNLFERVSCKYLHSSGNYIAGTKYFTVGMTGVSRIEIARMGSLLRHDTGAVNWRTGDNYWRQHSFTKQNPNFDQNNRANEV